MTWGPAFMSISHYEVHFQVTLMNLMNAGINLYYKKMQNYNI